MDRRTFVTVATGLSVVTGLLGLVAPAQVSAFFGVTLDDAGVSQTRLLGASYLGYAAIMWFARDVRDQVAQHAIAVGSFVSWALSTVVLTAAVVTGAAASLSWMLVAVAIVVTTTWGYFAFAGRSTAATTWASPR